MVRRAALQHCCKLRRSQQESIPSYIWISNEVLQSQWTRFSSSATVRSNPPSRRHASATQTHCTTPNALQYQILESHQNKPGSSGSFLQKRNGSAVPGPLEARKRRALRKHITGASHSDIFGVGSDFGGSSLRNGLEEAEEGMKSRLQNVYNHSNNLATTLNTIWKWWSSNPEAPVKDENDILPLLSEASIASSPFGELLAELDYAQTKTPQNIHQLLSQVFCLESSEQQTIVRKICSWIRTEVALGSMHEIDVKTMLWEVDQNMRVDYNSTKLASLTHICEAIGEGIASSAIRPAKDFNGDTIWLLFRSLACLSTQEHIFTTTLSHILQSVAAERRDQCVQLLQNLLGMVQFTFGVRKTYALDLLNTMPREISLSAILGLCDRLAKLCYSHQPQLRSRSSRQLKLLLIELSEHDLIADLHAHRNLKESWLSTEHTIFELGMPYTVAYLRTGNEAKVCSFILKHVVKDSRRAYTMVDEVAESTTPVTEDVDMSSHSQTYEGLLQFITIRQPHKTRSVIRFLYSFLRESGRAEECYNLSRHVFSKYGPGAQPSVEFLHGEISQWAKTSPSFAVLLLATDPRPGSERHPVLTSMIANLPHEGEAIPAEVVPALARLMVKRYGPDLDASDPTSKAPVAASTFLQLLLQPLAWGNVPEPVAFRLFQKILNTLAPVSHTLKKETSVAAIKLIAIKSLENRRKIPRRKMEWLAQVVTYLEGPEAWRETADRIEKWWSVIEAKNDWQK